MKIPAESLFGLLCYAWETPVPPSSLEAAATKAETPLDLFARLLADGVSALLHRGMERGYREHEEDTRRPRGRLDFEKTVQRNLRAAGRVHVRYERLSRDILPNRILCATMRRLWRAGGLHGKLRNRLAVLIQRTADVRGIRLRSELFDHVQIHRNNLIYRFLLRVCRLVHEEAIPEADGDDFAFPDYDLGDIETGVLFETAVRNFLRIEAPDLGVPPGNTQIHWRGAKAPEPGLPLMYSDIVVRRKGPDPVLVEIKCVRKPFTQGKLRSGHLYQVFAYLKNYPAGGPPIPGWLLYATVGDSFRYSGVLDGHPLHIRSLDLARPWPGVAAGLRRFARDLRSPPDAAGAA